MKHKRYLKNGLVLGLILAAGLGFALLLPWLANTQSLAAADSYAPSVGFNAPAVGPCYATPNDGATVFDSADNTAVQDAVDAAAPGALVKVAGTCQGVSIQDGISLTVYISKSLTLQGGHTHTDWSLEPKPRTQTTTLDADYAGRVVVISGTSNVTLDGLYIKHGEASDGLLFNRGGGIWSNSHVVLTDTIVFSNTAAWGGGIAVEENTSAFLYNVSIKENKAKHGGGMYVGKESDPKLVGVQFVDNYAFGAGGGMYNYLDSNPVLDDVTFTRNSAQLGGGMMNNNDSILRLTNVWFFGNSAVDGGAAYNDQGSRIDIKNAVFSGNDAEKGAGIFNSNNKLWLYNASISGNSASDMGGGLYNENAQAKINTTILWNNEANGIIGDISSVAVNDSGTTTFTYSLVQASGGSSGWLLGVFFADGTGNIDEDPKFVSPLDPTTAPTTTGNLRLLPGSPAIDAGRNSLATVPYDIEYKERIVDGYLDGTATVDMGAFEHYPYGMYLPLLLK